MPAFIVEVGTVGREVYHVVAESEDEAREIWYDGELINSEVDDYESVTVTEVDD